MKEKKTFNVVDVSSIKSHNDNPWGLVYDGAITENKKGKVNIHSINYDLNGLKISANVYVPADYDVNKRYAAVVVAHPNGGVKEQVAGLYSQRIAEAGYIVLLLMRLIREQARERLATWIILLAASRIFIGLPTFFRCTPE